jgi:hypothetical protein
MLTGRVVDASSGAAVADTVVTATSRQLQGEQVSVTDGTGTYQIPQLPPGVYTLRFEKEGYKPYSRREIALDVDSTLRLNVELLPEALKSEEITVVGKAPVVDVGSTQTGLIVTDAFSQSIPLSPASAANGGIRSYQGLALAAPGVAADLFGVSIAGTTSPENAYLIDGLSFSDTGYGVNNRANTGTASGITAGSDFSVEFVDQLNVITSGYMPEYGRTTGGVVSITTKSGGNEFHGSVFATWTPAFLAQAGKAVTSSTTIINASSKLNNSWDVGFTLGGYIIKDKLWFFVGFNPSQYKMEVTRTVSPFALDADGNPIPLSNSNGGGFEETPVPSATRNYYQTQTDYSYIGKLTYLINSDNRISLSLAGTPDSWTLPYASPNGDSSALSAAGNDNTVDMILQLRSSFLEKKLLLDLTVGWHHQNNNTTPIDGTAFGQPGDASTPSVDFAYPYNFNQFSADPAANDPRLAAICGNATATTPPPGGPPSTFGNNACPVAGYAEGGGFLGLRNITENRVQAKAIVTYFLSALGHQTLKGGVDVEWLTYGDQFGYTGQQIYFALSGPMAPANGGFYESYGLGYLSSPDNPIFRLFQDQTSTAVLPGGFIQDSWNILDKVTVNIGVRFDSEYVYTPQGLALSLNNQWAPRLGITWDPTYQGKAKVYASYGVYYEAVPLDLADKALTGAEGLLAFHFNCANPAATGQPCSNATRNLLAGGAGPNQYWFAAGADRELVDPRIGPTKTNEVTLGAECEVFSNARLGINYTHRGLSELIEDYSNNHAVSFVLGNPGLNTGSTLPYPVRTYNGYTVAFTKTFAGHWQAQASYTFITLNGNVDGLFAPNFAQLDPNITAAFDLPQFLINSYGPLSADTQSRIKLLGSYQFVFSATVGLTLGGVYLGYSGAPISALGGDSLYGANAIYIIPRGSYGRLPWVNEIDVHATVDIGLGSDTRLSLGADCFNLVGWQQVTAVDQSWVFPANTAVRPNPNGTVASLQHITSPNGTPLNLTGAYPPDGSNVYNSNFGHATAYQAPRNFRLLARFTF